MGMKGSKTHRLSKAELVSLTPLSPVPDHHTCRPRLSWDEAAVWPSFPFAFLLYRLLGASLHPSSLATIWLFGDVLTACRLLAEIGVITWLNRKKSCDQAIRSDAFVMHHFCR